MAFPLAADNLDGTFKLKAHFDQAIADEKLDAERQRIVELLREGRDLDSLRAVLKLIPARKFESYAPAALVERSRARVSRLKTVMPDLFTSSRVPALEIGCGRGEVLTALCAEPNAIGCGLDLVDDLFVKNRLTFPVLENVLMVKAPAEQIPFCEGTFDLVFGYNSMEHFDDPRRVVEECYRVLRPGGFMYFHFGPPFNGPFGPHLQHRLGLPYLHHLFGKEVVSQMLGSPGKDPYAGKNEWNTQQFRELFTRERRFVCRTYREEYVWDHLWLVRELPDDFAGFHPQELVIRALEVTCQKDPEQAGVRFEPESAAARPVNLLDASVETQAGDSDGAVLPASSANRFGIMLNNPNDPRSGDFTRLHLDVPADSDASLMISIRIHNAYHNPKFPGRIAWMLRVNGRTVHTEDISENKTPRDCQVLVNSPGPSVSLEVELKALRNCEPWKWGQSSALFIEQLKIERVESGKLVTKTV